MENFIEPKIVCNEGDEVDEGPSGERWPPLGAAAAEDDRICCTDYHNQFGHESDRLRDLEEQQELLNSSLIALTTHFAQVQFRLRQIIDAPTQDKEILLQDLEEFAFKGIPDMPDYQMSLHQDSKDFETAIVAQRMKQKELIGQLKIQLEELENYAYEIGEAGLPQNVIMEKQKVIIDELKGKLNLNVDDIDRLTLEDIRHQVDNAISELVNPLKMKEQLVTQLKTQIVDLERFIEFLQGEPGDSDLPESSKLKGAKKCSCHCPVHSASTTGGKLFKNYNSWKNSAESSKKTEEVREKTLNIMRRAAALLQIFAVSQFGCGSSIVRINSLKKSMKVHHWGDLRARLELAVVNILTLASDHETPDSLEYSSDSENCISDSHSKMTTAVRKQLAISIRDLMEHGLVSADVSNSLVPFMGCFSSRNKELPSMHAWELILRYYEIKNGARFNATPVRKLSQSFNLNIVGSKAVSSKQNMLSAIGNIISLHTQFKRSYDAQFKAFVCAALNSKKLVVWLRLIFRCEILVDTYYKPWSYVAKTGFEDSLQSLDKLTHLKFDLPVDIAVHQFQNIKDAF